MNNNPIKIILLILILFLLISLTVEAVDQDVTITVDPINEITVSSTTVTLNIDTANAGAEPVSVTDESTTMSYTTNQKNKKITASLSGLYDEGITLEIEVESLSGTSQGKVELSTTEKDIITGLSNVADQAQQITYTASATVEARPNSELGGQTQAVTFTITDQA